MKEKFILFSPWLLKSPAELPKVSIVVPFLDLGFRAHKVTTKGIAMETIRSMLIGIIANSISS